LQDTARYPSSSFSPLITGRRNKAMGIKWTLI
jgi:hypothetical protein